MACVLMGFQVVLDLSINLTKSEMVQLGDMVDRDDLAKIMRCEMVKLSIRYLGLPLGVNYKNKVM